ncbi:MAG: glycoside hydrolase family 13 protein [Oscillospiraceae bacterium]|jgi:glycosidase|nr:glycoside hydrolase family 13 protein [Oscillospiraceae bacterium]
MDIFFDAFGELCRSPQGAVTPGTELTLRFLSRRGLVRGAALTVWEDGYNSGEEFSCEFSAMLGAFELYEARFTPKKPGLYWLWFELNCSDGSRFICGPEDEKHLQLTVYETSEREPAKPLVMYHAFVDRFNAKKAGVPEWRAKKIGSDFFGGTLNGITEQLTYLQSLGVSHLYLSPIFTAPSNHKYNTVNFGEIDPGFGTESDFKRLCAGAKKRGISVILDGVFNHSAPCERYAKWTSGDYWWGNEDLPAFDKSNADYINYISGENGILAKWLKLGASGYRLDVVDELPDVFLKPLCARVREAGGLLIGECWEDPTNKVAYGIRRRYLLGGQLHGTMNYPFREAVLAYLTDNDASHIAGYLETFLANTPEVSQPYMMNLLGTHDTIRAMTILGTLRKLPPADERGRLEFSSFALSPLERALGERRMKLAALLQYALPGFPGVYYGDELGFEGGADPFNRAPLLFPAPENALRSYYETLGKLRRETPALSLGTTRILKASGGVFSFSREYEGAVKVFTIDSNV